MPTQMPTYFISHGGGPWPWIPAMREMFSNLENALVKMRAEKPKAVLMISGHWETGELAVMTAPNPPMVYDYSGFPPETYKIKYPAPGAPELARRTAGLLESAGHKVRLDSQQGFDHGTFAPMAVIWPEADMPTYQISIRKDYDPATHFAIGRALAPLRDEGVLIVGSGLSFHNLRMFGPEAKIPSAAFDAWLGETLALPAPDRTAALLNWESAPYARVCHAQEDHLVPLFVAMGAAETATAERVYHDVALRGGVTASSYRFN